MSLDFYTALNLAAIGEHAASCNGREWGEEIQVRFRGLMASLNNGNLPRWVAAYQDLPDIHTLKVQLDVARVSAQGQPMGPTTHSALKSALLRLQPWRKGPFELHGVSVDTEWRSDWKWARVAPHLSPLKGRRVLDVGCGNGYYGWRMLGVQAKWVLGIDPNWLFMLQYLAVQRYLGRDRALHLLPFTLEDFVRRPVFDTVFSMGVLYHRRDPAAHLQELTECLRPGGELVLETLVVEPAIGKVLIPDGRYARMRNVWTLPTSATLCDWLSEAGFEQCRVVDESMTSQKEQRATEWMQFESLDKCLDPTDPSRTVEGYPAPRRSVVIAQKPS